MIKEWRRRLICIEPYRLLKERKDNRCHPREDEGKGQSDPSNDFHFSLFFLFLLIQCIYGRYDGEDIGGGSISLL